jgi:hypothetical protein
VTEAGYESLSKFRARQICRNRTAAVELTQTTVLFGIGESPLFLAYFAAPGCWWTCATTKMGSAVAR